MFVQFSLALILRFRKYSCIYFMGELNQYVNTRYYQDFHDGYAINLRSTFIVSIIRIHRYIRAVKKTC